MLALSACRDADGKGHAALRLGGTFGLGHPLQGRCDEQGCTVRSAEFVTRLTPGREVMWCRSEGGVTSCHVWRFTAVTPERTFVVNAEVFHGAPVGVLAPFVQSRWSRLFQQSVSGLARAAETIRPDSGAAPAAAP